MEQDDLNCAPVIQRMDERGFESKFGVTAIEAAKSWPVRWTAKKLNDFLNWCILNRLHPYAPMQEVQVQEFKGVPSWFAGKYGAIRSLVRFKIITDIIQCGVVYVGEEYEWQGQRLHHLQTANTLDNQVQVHFAYIVVRRTNGLELSYKLTQEQLFKPNRKKKSNELWETERHNMIIKTMWIYAYKQLSSLNVDGPVLAFEDDVQEDDQDWGTTPAPETPPATTDETPF
jgi:hypothetical protein